MFETWFSNGDKTLVVLTSKDRCFVVFMKHLEDSGTIARQLWQKVYWHPLVDCKVPFLLENGQANYFDYADTISAAEAMRVVAYFMKHGEPAPFVSWGDLGASPESEFIDEISN